MGRVQRRGERREFAMTHFLASQNDPDGRKLEEILAMLRRDVITQSEKIAEDPRPEARQVLDNNVRILQLLTEAIHLSETSTRVLDRAFGPSQSGSGGSPRIGRA